MVPPSPSPAKPMVDPAHFAKQSSTLHPETPSFLGSTGVCYISLSSGKELLIDKDLTIDGQSRYLVTISGDTSRAFHVAPKSSVTLANLEISFCYPTSGTEGGGAIWNTGNLIIQSCTIRNNAISPQSTRGGAIANDGNLTIIDSTISENSSYYFGVPSGYGGGIDNTGHLTISNSTLQGNVARTSGGAINSVGPGAVLTVSNSTVSGNTAIDLGGDNCGGGITNGDGSALTINGTIIAGNYGPTGPDLCGPATSNGFNLIGNNADTIITPAQSSDLIGTPDAPIDPLLGMLQGNGGSTQTQALGANSPAVNHGDPNAPIRDQRGYFRADTPDIGAFEYGATIPVFLANISTRLQVGTGDNALIGGFIITGNQSKRVLVRAIGPSLPVPGALADPTLQVEGDGFGINDNWRSNQEAEIIATGIPPTNDLESAVITTLTGSFTSCTATVRGVNDGTGVGLVEVYDLNPTTDSTLRNISTRGLVQTGDNVLIAGTIVVGHLSQEVIVRGIGPSLNLPGKLEDPSLELRDANGELIRANDNWRTDQETEIIATGIPPTNDLEAAIVETLVPSNYTAILRGTNDSTGIALVEIYRIP